MIELIIAFIGLIVYGFILWLAYDSFPHADVPSVDTWINEKENIQVEFHNEYGVDPGYIKDCLKDASTKLGIDLKFEDFNKASMPRLFRGEYLADGTIDYVHNKWKLNTNHYLMRRVMSLEEVSSYGS